MDGGPEMMDEAEGDEHRKEMIGENKRSWAGQVLMCGDRR